MSVYLWRHFGDRWQYQYIDVAKCIDRSLCYQRKQSDKSTKDLQLRTVQVLPRLKQLAVADNRGTIRLFELLHEKAALRNTYHLHRPVDPLLQLGGGPGQPSAPGNVEAIHFTKDEQVAIVTFENCLVSAYDISAGFAYLGDLEKEVQRLSLVSTSNLTKVLEREDSRADLSASMYGWSSHARSSSTTFSLFSLRGPNCIKQLLVEVRDHKVLTTPLTKYFIDEGKIAGYDIHPSKDYILVTSTKGKIYLFRIDTGELRGTIEVPLHAQGCLVDPSGLYVVVKVPPFSPRHIGANLAHRSAPLADEFSTIGINERDLTRTTILMYEVGTKKVAAEVHSIFDITTMAFSSDGRYLALGSQKGAVSVWALGDHIYRGVS